MTMISENELEQLCLSWFQENGYQTITGKQISPEGETPERKSYRQVVLHDRLASQLRVINPEIPAGLIEDVAHTLEKPETPVLIKNNHLFHKYLLEGFPVEINGDEANKIEHVKLIDFDNAEHNQFLVVNQFTITGTKHLRRPDLIVFINGLPIAVIELKNPADEGADIWDAYNQLQTYKDEISDLFVFNQALVISDGLTARVGSLTASKEWFMPWRTIKDENDKPNLKYELEKLVKGFFDRELLLDYLKYFILFEETGDTIIKKIAGYHQFHAVRQAVRATIIAAKTPRSGQVEESRATWGRQVEEGSRKAGVVWHTQGSGKSISMVCYAGKLLTSPEMKSPTLVVVTDRNDLDGQLFDTFNMARENLKQTPVQASNRDELRDILSTSASGGIIFSTVQKFALIAEEQRHPVLSNRHNLVVISDEAHRSQYGDKAKLNKKNRTVYVRIFQAFERCFAQCDFYRVYRDPSLQG